MKYATALFPAIISAAISAPVLAAPPHDPYINAQQHRQHERLQQGVRSGQLTRNETRQLAAQQHGLRQQERAYKSDGVMTSTERQDMRQDQRAASQSIHAEKHDAEVQPRIHQ